MLPNFVQRMRVKPAGLALFASLALALSACGGGGGDPGMNGANPTLVVTIVNQAGDSVTSITTTAGAFARATVKDSAGRAVVNTVVQFTGLGIAFTPASGTALTDGAGMATVGMLASGLAGTGAVEISASTVVGSQSASGKVGISITVP